MTSGRRHDIEQAAKERRAAIRACRACDPQGWRLGPDGLTADIAIRCDHTTTPPTPARDISEPIREPDLFTEPTHERNTP